MSVNSIERRITLNRYLAEREQPQATNSFTEHLTNYLTTWLNRICGRINIVHPSGLAGLLLACKIKTARGKTCCKNNAAPAGRSIHVCSTQWQVLESPQIHHQTSPVCFTQRRSKGIMSPSARPSPCCPKSKLTTTLIITDYICYVQPSSNHEIS